MSPLLLSAVAVAGLFALAWLVSLTLRDASVADVFWGLGFVLVAWVVWWFAAPAGSAPADPARLLLPTLVSLWGLRLSVYLLWRNWGEGEDPRYVAMRERNPPFWLTSLWIVFGLQGVLLWVIALPVTLALGAEPRLGPWVAPGCALWGVGLVVESLADWQLARFKGDPANAGKVLDRGLWRVSRHPNYFGEFVLWWGIFAVALAQGAPAWTGVGPLVISFLLMKVSGVPLLESRLKKTRPEYADYVRRTPAFFPGRPAPPDGGENPAGE
jgi:steroid 5-alpha reductase family enzyme